jgi:hypothetical protein
LSGDTSSYLKRVLRESLAAMEDLEQAAPGLSDDAFVFGSWEYFALAITATISEANKKGLQPSAIDDLTEELVGESVKLLASTADVTPDRQALVEPTVRDLLITRGREYFQTDPTSFRNSLFNTFARNVVQTCQLKKTTELAVAATAPSFLARVEITQFVSALN